MLKPEVSHGDRAFRSQPMPHISILCIGSSCWPSVFPCLAPTTAIGAITVTPRGPSHHLKVRFRYAPTNGSLQARGEGLAFAAVAEQPPSDTRVCPTGLTARHPVAKDRQTL
jgi:hypothetical protein